VAEVRRRVAFRRSARAGALAVAAVAVLLATWLPGSGGGTGPAPIHPPTASPTPGASGSPGTPSRSPGHTTSTGPAINTTPTCPNAERFLTHTDPDTYSISTELINACPAVRLHLVRVTYIGLGAAPTRLTRYAAESHTLTPSSRAATFRAAGRPTGTCYTRVSVTVASPGGGTPSSIANPLPGAGSGGDPLPAIRAWFSQHGYPPLDAEWSDPQC
jgi:hypothetical protein